MFREIVIGALIFALGSPPSTYVVDVTGIVPRHRAREPQTASSQGGFAGGNAGATEAKSLIDVNVLSVDVVRDGPEPYILFQLQAVNTGTEEFQFPVDPNLADFEPGNANIPYGYITASVALVLDLKPQGSIFIPGVSLYGSKEIADSFRKLEHGESIRIRARTPLKIVDPISGLKIPARSSLRAELLIQQNFVVPRQDGLHEDSKQILPQIRSMNAVPFSRGP